MTTRAKKQHNPTVIRSASTKEGMTPDEIKRDPWSFALTQRPLITRLARRFVTYGVPLDDLVQVGLIAAYRAVRSWDPTLGAIEPRVWKIARQDIWTYVATHELYFYKESGNTNPLISLDEPIGEDEDEQTKGDLLEDGNDELREQQREDALIKQLLSILPQQERTVIELRFGLTPDGIACSHREIQRRTGREQHTTRNLEDRAIMRMQAYAVHRLKLPGRDGM